MHSLFSFRFKQIDSKKSLFLRRHFIALINAVISIIILICSSTSKQYFRVFFLMTRLIFLWRIGLFWINSHWFKFQILSFGGGQVSLRQWNRIIIIIFIYILLQFLILFFQYRLLLLLFLLNLHLILRLLSLFLLIIFSRPTFINFKSLRCIIYFILKILLKNLLLKVFRSYAFL